MLKLRFFMVGLRRRFSMARVCLVDGFVPYHFSVIVQESAFRDTVTWVKSKQSKCREDGTCGPPEPLLVELQEHPSVLEAVAEGPYSSAAIPAAMARFWGDCTSVLTGWSGRGPIAAALHEQLHAWNIDNRLVETGDTDSSVEISIRSESFDQHETVRLHPTRRKAQVVRFRWPETLTPQQVQLYFMTKLSQGRADAAESVQKAGGLCSTRIGMFTRHRAPDDYFAALPHFHHIVVAHKDLRATARAAKISPPRGWPASLAPNDPLLLQLAEFLKTDDDHRRLVIFNALDETLFVVPGLQPVHVQPPSSYDRRTRTSRIQGAAGVAGLDLPDYVPTSQDELKTFANQVVQAAYHGTEGRPSSYPSPDFQPEGSWLTIH